MATTVAANSASLTNKGSDDQTIVLTEGGVKNELSIAAGETVTFCNGGCFLTLPNGDRMALSGPETVELNNGEAVVK